MYYWNRTNFEGLRAVALSLADRPELADFAAYCEMRHRGLRQQAMDRLTAFLACAGAWSTPDRRRFANWICEVHSRNPGVHQLIAEPLKRWLVSVLHSWAAEDVGATPRRWLGLLTHETRFFDQALQADPADDFSRSRAVDALVGEIEYATHHIPEGFIGDPQAVLDTAAEAEKLLAGFRDSAARDLAREDIEQAKQKVLDWVEFKAAQTAQSFETWCASTRGYTWSTLTRVYYGEEK
jgi:hypothetical protein